MCRGSGEFVFQLQPGEGRGSAKEIGGDGESFLQETEGIALGKSLTSFFLFGPDNSHGGSCKDVRNNQREIVIQRPPSRFAGPFDNAVDDLIGRELR